MSKPYPSKHTDLDDHVGLSTFGQAGMYCVGAPWYGAAVMTLVATRAHIVRFVPPRNIQVVSIAFGVSTAAGSDDSCDVGLYDAAYAKIVTAGATAGKLNGIGVKTIPIVASLLANTVYYAAFSTGTIGTTAAVLAGLTTGGNNTQDLFGTTAGLREFSFQAVHPLPVTFVPGGSIGVVPLLAVRET